MCITISQAISSLDSIFHSSYLAFEIAIAIYIITDFRAYVTTYKLVKYLCCMQDLTNF